MLNILESHGGGSGREMSRRELLSVGSLGLGGLTLPALLAGQAQAGTGRSVPSATRTSSLLRRQS